MNQTIKQWFFVAFLFPALAEGSPHDTFWSRCDAA